MKVSKDRFGLVSATLAFLAASALVASGIVGLGLAPAKKAEASSALRLEQPSSHGSLAASATADLDAADKSAALKKTARALPAAAVLVAVPRKTKTSTKTPARKRITVSRGERARFARVTGSGWRFARVSWYGPGFYGHTMAGGGTLTRTSMVVAHRSLPFGTRVEFRYHGRTCVAVVKDRGPYVAGRSFDLGPGTAAALGFSGASTVSYRIIGR